MLVMSVAAAGLALASLCYYLMLPPCVAAPAISSTRSSSIQRDGVKHTQFYSVRGNESLWQSCFTSRIHFANRKTPWTQLSIDNILVSNSMGIGGKRSLLSLGRNSNMSTRKVSKLIPHAFCVL